MKADHRSISSVLSVDRSGVQRGFTLIELMIVVGIVAILVAIAYPSYADSVRKSRRGQAKADLVAASQIAERYRTINNNSYEHLKVGTASDDQISSESPGEGTVYYNIALSNHTATTYTLTATPVAGSDQANDTCGALSIDQAGAKTHAAGDDAVCGFGTLASAD